MKTLLALLFLAGPIAVPKPLPVDAYVQPYVERNAVSGVILVAKGDEIVFENAARSARISPPPRRSTS